MQYEDVLLSIFSHGGPIEHRTCRYVLKLPENSLTLVKFCCNVTNPLVTQVKRIVRDTKAEISHLSLATNYKPHFSHRSHNQNPVFVPTL